MFSFASATSSLVFAVLYLFNPNFRKYRVNFQDTRRRGIPALILGGMALGIGMGFVGIFISHHVVTRKCNIIYF